MADSILTSIKAALGVPEAHVAFDPELIMHINSVLSRLTQLGVGPPEGFRITNKDATWEELIDDELRLNNIKSYAFNRVKMLFDPPDIGFVITAMKEQIEKDEWLISETHDDLVDEAAAEVVVVVEV